MVRGSRVTVTTTATQLTGTVNTREKGAALVRNRGAVSVDLGGPDVVTGAGFQLDAGETVPIDVDSGNGDLLYAVTASGTCVVHVLAAGR